MKKIMFNDKYGLTEAVLSGRKTMTRRIIPMKLHRKDKEGTLTEIQPDEMDIVDGGIAIFRIGDKGYRVPRENQPAYKIGEVLAVAQPYKSIVMTDPIFFDALRREAGWTNKMFVEAKYMPHCIRITDIKPERLQDISDEDCMREGIVKLDTCTDIQPFPEYFVHDGDGWMKSNTGFDGFWTPQDAFASLIDRISGKGTWQRNPWTWAYEFELIR